MVTPEQPPSRRFEVVIIVTLILSAALAAAWILNLTLNA